MLTLLLTAGVAIFLALSYLRLPLYAWALAYLLLILTAIFLLDPGIFTQAIIWGFYALLFVPLLFPPLRRTFLTFPLYRFYKKQLPQMSPTEQEALEAGTVWWDKDLFSGNPDWNKLLSFPANHLTVEERDFLNGQVEEVCNMIDDWKVTNEDHDLPDDVWRYFAENRFFAMIIPRQYGGLGFSAQAHSEVVLKLSTRSVTAAVSVMVPNSLGPGMLLIEYGTEKQKDYYLPRLANGTEIPCFALTSPEAGSDAASMIDQGIVCYGEHEGKKDILGIRLTWNKRYITLAPIATLLGLAFKLYDPDHLLGEEEELGITLALVPTNHPGVHIGERHMPLHIPFQNGPTHGEDVFIPMEWVIGGKDRVGQGWRMLMECLSDGRSISLPALSVGAAKLASRTSGAYARIRQQFNIAIGDFEGIRERLARVAGLTYLMDSARTLILTALDEGEKPSVLSAVVKYHLTESMRIVINDAMDVHGGKGIMLGPKNYLANIYDSIPIGITVEGANILTRNMIIFGQGAIRCHPYVIDEIRAAGFKNNKEGLVAFDRVIFSHGGFIISNFVKTTLLGLSSAHLHRPNVDKRLKPYYQQLMRMSAVFALLVDVNMLVIGGELKRKENISARLGDVFSYLYLATACLKRFNDQGKEEEDMALVDWSVQFCLYQIQDAISGLLRNFPVRSIGMILRLIIFPFGRNFYPPSDNVNSRVAKIILSDSAARDRLTDGIFVPESSSDQIALLEDVFQHVIACTPLFEKLRLFANENKIRQKNMKAIADQARSAARINDEEYELLCKMFILREQVIAVDDFNSEEFSKRTSECNSEQKAII